MQQYLSLAEVEEIVGGNVDERREKIRRAGLAGDLRWTREVFESGLTRWVRATDWVPEPEWERERLALLRGHVDERGVRVEIRRDCASPASASPKRHRTVAADRRSGIGMDFGPSSTVGAGERA